MATVTDPKQIVQMLSTGQHNAAFKAARIGLKKHPKAAVFFNLAGLALAQQGREREAILYLQKALKLTPLDPDVQGNLTQAMVMAGQHERAQALLDRLIAKSDSPSAFLYLRAMSEHMCGDLEKAAASLDAAIEIEPAMASSLNLRGVLRHSLGDDHGAIEDYEASLRAMPNSADTLSNYSMSLVRMFRSEEAFDALKQALELTPDHINSRQRYAIQLNEAGRKDEAIAAYHSLLETAPHHAEALCELAMLQGADGNVALLRPITAALAKASKKSADYAILAFARARVATSCGAQDDSEKWLQIANDAMARLNPVTEDEATEEAQILRMFARPAPQNDDNTLPKPIFVLGQPRSGTTLVEQVLSGHSDVFGAGELSDAARLVDPLLKSDAVIDEKTITAFAADYRAALPAVVQAHGVFVDKMPHNYRLIGFLAAAFPQAVILNITRDPRDVALSMWRTKFPASAMRYTFDMASMAEQANRYRRFMNHWHALLPGRVIDLAYSDLVSDIEPTSRQLAEDVGISWQPEMASPEKNKSPVRTASVNQVRGGVHTRSLGGWRAHREMLAPFIAGLDSALWPELED